MYVFSRSPAGYSKTYYVRRGFAGLGQAPATVCPSLEQAMGISDPTDPCQSTAGACFNSVTGAVQTCPTSGNVQTTVPSNLGPFGTPTNLTSWFSQNSGLVLGIGAAIAAVMLLQAAE